jgi:hypothetical protein
MTSVLAGVRSASGRVLMGGTWVRGILLGTHEGTKSDIWAFSLLSQCSEFTCTHDHCVINFHHHLCDAPTVESD